jgi:uncharacterized OB-fold protein
MALIKCSECGQEISDMAIACPKCGKPTGVKEPDVAEERGGGTWVLMKEPNVAKERCGGTWVLIIAFGIILGVVIIALF